MLLRVSPDDDDEREDSDMLILCDDEQRLREVGSIRKRLGLRHMTMTMIDG